MKPDILSVFRQLAGNSANSWQSRLIERFVSGDLPGALDIPTGLGKTAVIPIWAAARACGAPVPRRLVYVVDRRVVVDQATAIAETVADRIGNDSVLAQSMGIVSGTLVISTLRGQHADNRRWLLDPTAPAIVIGTVDMIGSRLLFEGYGVSRGTRSMHAGLLARDTLLVLDENHLVPAFDRLAAWISMHAQSEAYTDIAPPLKVMTMSATGDANKDVFALDPKDKVADPWIKRRLSAPKRALLVEIEAKSLVTELVARARRLSANGSCVVVFADSFRDASKVIKELQKKWWNDASQPCDPPQLARLTGQTRVAERAQLVSDPVFKRFASYDENAGSGGVPSVLVTTSAGEVGANFSGDHLVCDLVAWERMVQRLGRANRAGSESAAMVDILIDPAKSTTVDKAMKVDAALVKLKMPFVHSAWPRDEQDRIDMSPENLLEMRQHVDFMEAVHGATTPAPWFAPLNNATLDAWSMTSLEMHAARPSIEPWLRGWQDDTQEPDVTLVWRRWLPTSTRTGDYLRDAPVHLLERLETGRSVAQEWLSTRIDDITKSTERNELKTGGNIVALSIDRLGNVQSLRWSELTSAVTCTDKKQRPPNAFATLILDSRIGGLDDYGILDANCANDAIAWDSVDEAFLHEPSDQAETHETADLVTQWRNRFSCIERRLRHGPLDTALHEGGVRPGYVDGETAELESDIPTGRWIERLILADADQRSNSPQGLAEHQAQVSDCIGQFADRLALPAALTRALVVAAEHHDDGKHCDHWQSAMRVPTGQRPLAKTAGLSRPLDLAGYRHEFGSLLKLESNLTDLDDESRDLVRHLIAAHHGNARPFLRAFDPERPPLLRLDRKDPTSDELATEIARRFIRLQDRYGHYGLAWLESLLRCADWMASSTHASKVSS